MAELGTAASVIGIVSLAIQVGDSVLKLKSFCSQIKQAPEDIQFLIMELETLHLVLDDIGKTITTTESTHDGNDNDETPILPAESASKCLDQCRKGAQILDGVVKSLDVEIGKGRRVGGLKAVLKKDKMDRLRERLRSAQFLLMLSNQTYHEAVQKQRHEIEKKWAEAHRQELSELQFGITQSLDAISTAQESPVSAFTACQPTKPIGVFVEQDYKTSQGTQLDPPSESAVARKKFFNARLNGPSWLFFNHALEISYGRISSGWRITVRNYRVHSWNSDLHRYVNEGDIASIQRLLERKEASPFDTFRNVSGKYSSLLTVASNKGKVAVCKLLLDQGAGSDEELMMSTIERSVFSVDCPSQEYTDILRIMLHAKKKIDLSELVTGLVKAYWGTSNWYSDFGFSLEKHQSVLQLSALDLQQLDLKDRVRYVINLSWYFGFRRFGGLVSFIRFFLGGSEVNSQVCNITDIWSRNLLHSIARYFGKVFTLWKHDCEFQNALTEVFELMHDLVIGGSDLHAQFMYSFTLFQDTPLLVLLQSLGCCGYLGYDVFMMKHSNFEAPNFETYRPAILRGSLNYKNLALI